MLVHRRVTPSSKFAGTHLYTWVERGTMRVKYLAQENNAVPQPGLEPRPPDPEPSALTIRPPRLPPLLIVQKKNINNNLPRKSQLRLLLFFFFPLLIVQKNNLNCDFRGRLLLISKNGVNFEKQGYQSIGFKGNALMLQLSLSLHDK